MGYVTLALKLGDKPTSGQSAIEFLSTKVGLVLLVLGRCISSTCSVIASGASARRMPSPRDLLEGAMRRQLIDRMADTLAFRILLVLSGLMVLPGWRSALLMSPSPSSVWSWA